MSIHDMIASSIPSKTPSPEANDNGAVGSDSDDSISSPENSPRSGSGSRKFAKKDSKDKKTSELPPPTPFYTKPLFWFFVVLFILLAAGITIGILNIAEAKWSFAKAFAEYLSLRMLLSEIFTGVVFVSLVIFGIGRCFQGDDVKANENGKKSEDGMDVTPVTLVTPQQCVDAEHYLEGFFKVKFSKQSENEVVTTIARLRSFNADYQGEWRELICYIEALYSVCFSVQVIGRNPSADIVACRDQVRAKIDTIIKFCKQKKGKYLYKYLYIEGTSKDDPFIAGQQAREAFNLLLSPPQVITMHDEQKLPLNTDSDYWAPHFAAVDAKRQERIRMMRQEYLRLSRMSPVQRVEAMIKTSAEKRARRYARDKTPPAEQKRIEEICRKDFAKEMVRAKKEEEEKRREEYLKNKAKMILAKKKKIYKYTAKERAELDAASTMNMTRAQVYFLIDKRKDARWEEFCRRNKYTEEELDEVMSLEISEESAQREQEAKRSCDEVARMWEEYRKRTEAEEKKSERPTDNGTEARYLIIVMLSRLLGDGVLELCKGDAIEKENKFKSLFKRLHLRLHPDKNRGFLWKSTLCAELLNSLTPSLVLALFENVSKEKLRRSEYYMLGTTMEPRSQEEAENFFKDYTRLCTGGTAFDSAYARGLLEEARKKAVSSSSIASTSAVLSGSSSSFVTVAPVVVSASTSNSSSLRQQPVVLPPPPIGASTSLPLSASNSNAPIVSVSVLNRPPATLQPLHSDSASESLLTAIVPITMPRLGDVKS